MGDMEHDFWHQRWSEGRIGFHQAEVNTFLKDYWSQLELGGQGGVFVPLCGKSRDMLWLKESGHDVLGVELSREACESFFEEMGAVGNVERREAFGVHYSEGITLLCGDFFALSEYELNAVVAVYDRAALVALPEEMRKRYAVLLNRILPKGVKLLLVTLEFDALTGPPFSVSESEVRTLFSQRFDVQRLGSGCDGDKTEVVWLLRDK